MKKKDLVQGRACDANYDPVQMDMSEVRYQTTPPNVQEQLHIFFVHSSRHTVRLSIFLYIQNPFHLGFLTSKPVPLQSSK